jgi:hypothetical protein
VPILLKQSTQVVISFGPFLLNTDGVTLVINLVGTGANQTENTSTGIRISKNGGAFAARAATATASTYDAFGNYLVTLKTGDVDTLGVLRVQYANGAAFCPVWKDYLVVAANIYDSLVGGGDVLDVSAIQILGTAISTPATAGILDVNAKNWVNQAIVTPAVTGVPKVDLVDWLGSAPDALSSGKLPADVKLWLAVAPNALVQGKIDAEASVRSGTAQAGAAGTITLDASASAVTDFYKGMMLLIVSATGVGQARLCTAYNGSTKVASVAPNWATNPDATSVFMVIPQAGVDVELWGAIVVNALISGRVDANLGAVASGVIAAGSFAAAALDAVWSTASRLLTAGTNIVLAKGVGVTGFNDLSSAQVNTEADTALADYDGPTHAELTAELATADDAVLAAVAALNNLSQADIPTAAAVADAVWDEDATGHQAQGSFGQAIGDPVADTNTIYKAVVTDAAGATVGVDVVAVKTETASILADTNELQTDLADGGRLDLLIDGIKVKTDNLPPDPADQSLIIAATDAIISDTNDIQERLPAALVVGRMDSSTGAMAAGVVTAAAVATNAIDADALAADAVTEIQTGLSTSAALAIVQADTDDIQTRLPAALVGGRMAANAEVVGDKTGYALSSAGITAIWAEVMEGVITAVQMMRGFAATLLGKAHGLGTATAVYRSLDDNKDRIIGTVDADGNRSAVTRDLT